MRKRLTTIVTLAAFVALTCSCSFYLFEQKPPSYVDGLSRNKESRLRVRDAFLNTNEAVAFSEDGLGRIQDGMISGDKSISRLAVAKDAVADVQKSPRGEIKRIQLRDLTVYHIRLAEENPTGYFVYSGTTPVKIPMAHIKTMTIRKPDALKSWLVSVAGGFAAAGGALLIYMLCSSAAHGGEIWGMF